jgi:hypothetical protein
VRIIDKALEVIKNKKKYFCLDVSDEDSTVWVVGLGRSGTTWVSELINHKNDYRLLFEPFHPCFVECVREYPKHLYMRRDMEDENLKSFYERVFSGKIKNERVKCFRGNYNDKIIYKKKVVKDIFCCMMTDWISENFENLKKVLVLRHPCAVALSRCNHRDGKWLKDMSKLLNQDDLYDDYLHKVDDVILNAKSFFKKQVVLWCVVNSVMLDKVTDKSTHVVFYEELVSESDKTIRKLFKHVSEPLGKEIGQIFSQESSTSWGKRSSPEERLLSWKKSLGKNMIKDSMKILKRFSLYSIYSERVMPINKKVHNFSFKEV